MTYVGAVGAKLRELILHLCLRSEGDRWFGMTKLKRLLFFIDLAAMRRFSHTVTGQEYRKMPHGPVPMDVEQALASLEDSGAAITRERTAGGYTQKRTFALRDPAFEHFTTTEIALADEILDEFRVMTAGQISELSHQYPGWRRVEMYEKIPFAYAFISDRPSTDAERNFAETLVDMPELKRLHAR